MTKQDPSVKLMESTSKLVSTLSDIEEESKPTVDFIEKLALGNRLCCSKLHKESFVDAVETAGGGAAFLDTCLYLKDGERIRRHMSRCMDWSRRRLLSCARKTSSMPPGRLITMSIFVLDDEKEVSVEVQEKYQAFLEELQRTKHFPRHPKCDPETSLGKMWLEYMKAAGHEIL